MEEAQGGWTRAEFGCRMSGGLKVAREARDWLRICREARLAPPNLVEPLIALADEVVALLTAILPSSRSG